MFDKNLFAFDAQKFAEVFKTADMTKMFEGAKMPGFDAQAIFAAQQKNMEALVEANKAAAAGYQDLFKKQVAIAEATMTAAQAQLSELKMDALSAEGAQKQADLMKDGFEKAVANLSDLADTAKKANSEALEIVQARVQAAIEEIKDMSAKATA
jgi:phasin family protein